MMRPLAAPFALSGLVILAAGFAGCAAAPPAQAATVRSGSPQHTPARLLYPLINADEARFVSLGAGTWEEGAPGRRLEYGGDGFHFLVAPTPAVPAGLPARFTLLTESGPCDVSGGELVMVARRHDEEETEDYYGSTTALALELPANGCGEARFAYAAGRSTTLTLFELDDPEFEEPRHGRAPSLDLACVVTYPPSEDGICPGFPPSVVIRAAGSEIFRSEVLRWVSALGILELAGQRYVVVGDFFGFDVLTLSGEVVESATHVGAVDLAQTCD